MLNISDPALSAIRSSTVNRDTTSPLLHHHSRFHCRPADFGRRSRYGAYCYRQILEESHVNLWTSYFHSQIMGRCASPGEPSVYSVPRLSCDPRSRPSTANIAEASRSGAVPGAVPGNASKVEPVAAPGCRKSNS